MLDIFIAYRIRLIRMGRQVMSKLRRSPTRTEILDQMEIWEVALSAMMRRWDDDIPAETRDEIAQVYQPLLRILIRAKRRGQPHG